LILYNERVKDVLFERGGIVLIHCVTMTEELYMFTICVDHKLGGSIGSALPTPLGTVLAVQGSLSIRSRVIIPSSSKR
jgi:hypothetical protein